MTSLLLLNLTEMKCRIPMPRVLVALLALLLSGCLSIPVSTLWKLRKFDEKTIRDLDPAVLQGVVLNQNGPRFNPAGLRIHIRFDETRPTADCFRAELRLRTLDEPPPADLPKLPRAEPGDNWTVLTLDEISLQRFLKIQQALRAMPADSKVKMDFDADFGKSPASIRPAPPPYYTNVWMRIQAAQGYLRLFERLYVDPSDEGKAAEKEKPKVEETACRDVS